MKKQLLASGLILCFGAAMAQDKSKPYATVTEVDGLVTVTTKSQLSNAVKDMPLIKGSEIMATSSGRARVVFSDGCDATVRAGQSLRIEAEACLAFVASSKPAGFVASHSVALGLLGAGTVALLASGRANVSSAAPGTSRPPAPAAPTKPMPPVVCVPTSGA